MRIKTSKRIVAYIGLIIFSLFAVIPVVYVFLLSLQTDAEAASLPPTIIPEVPRIENFSIVTERIPIGRYTLNSLIFAVGTTIVVIITSLFAGYASTKLQMPGRRFLVSIFLGSVLIPPATRMIPLYTLIARLDLVDTWAGLSLPYMATGFGLFFMYQFMKSIPHSVVEAARIDGCSENRIVMQIVAPLAVPGLVTLLIYNFLFRWNEYLWPLLVTRKAWRTLPVGVSIFKTSEQLVTWNLIAAAAVVTLIPVLTLFLALGGRIIKGISIQASK